jgi:predicted small lipoprotein YifL
MLRIVLFSLLIVFGISACGQKGPLYLPQEPQTPAPPPPSLPQQDGETSDADELQLQEDEPSDDDDIQAVPEDN